MGWDITLHLVLHVRQTLLRQDENSKNTYGKEKAAVKGASSCNLERWKLSAGATSRFCLEFSSQAGLCLVDISASQSQMQK